MNKHTIRIKKKMSFKRRGGASMSLYSTKNLIENGKFDLNKVHQKFNENTVVVNNKTSVPGWYFDANIYKGIVEDPDMQMFPSYKNTEYFACLMGTNKIIRQEDIELQRGKYNIMFERCKMYGTVSANLNIDVSDENDNIKHKLLKDINTDRWIRETIPLNITKDGKYAIMLYTRNNEKNTGIGIADVKLIKTSNDPNSDEDEFTMTYSSDVHNQLEEKTENNSRQERLSRGRDIRRQIFEKYKMGMENTRKIKKSSNKKIKVELNKVNGKKYIDFLKKQLKYYEKMKEIITERIKIAKTYPSSIKKDILIYNESGKHRETKHKFTYRNPENILRLNNLTELLKDYEQETERLKNELYKYESSSN
jgi:hypothetical protein